MEDRQVDNIPMNKHPYRVQVVGASGEQITSFGGGGDVTISGEVEVKNDTGNPVPVSASSLPLPTGASTAADQATGNSSLSTIATNIGTTGADAKRIQGNSASGVTDIGDPMTIAGVYESALPTFTAGQRGKGQIGSRGSLNVTLMGQDLANPINTMATNTDAVATSAVATRLQTVALMSGYNSSSFDRWYSNWATSILSSAVRAATTNGADQTNYNGRGVMVTINVTVEAAAETLSLKIQGKDPISGNYFDIVDFGTVYNATTDAPTTTRTFVMYPGVLSADFIGITGNGASGKAGLLPRTWRPVVTHSSSGNWTYSLASAVIL